MTPGSKLLPGLDLIGSIAGRPRFARERLPRALNACSVLSVLLLAIAPPLHADERNAAPAVSPYRLAINTHDGLPSNGPAGSYQLDQRYRLLDAAAATPAVSAAPLPDKPYARQIDAAARDAGLDPALVHAVVSVESAYQAAAVSPKGAVGLMQVLPETALRYGVTDPARVSENLRAGTRHLRGLMLMFDNRIDLVLAAYNAGEGAVRRYNNTIPPYPETRHYVPAVIGKYEAATRRPVSKSAVKLAAREYLPGTRLDLAELSRLR